MGFFQLKTFIQFLTVLHCLVGLQAYNLTIYSSFKYCQTNATCNENSECCGYIEYEKNGAGMQTSSRCLPIDKFEDLWNLFIEGNKNIENLAIGCRLDSEEDGLSLDPAGTVYSGPEISGGMLKITQKLTYLILTVVLWIMI